MSATTKLRPQRQRPVSSIDLPVKASTKILGGWGTCTDASGWAVPATSTTGLKFWGMAQQSKDNTSGSNGDLTINVQLPHEITVHLWLNDTGTPVTNAMRGTQIYMMDNQTLTGDSTGRSLGPFVYEVTTEGVWAFWK